MSVRVTVGKGMSAEDNLALQLKADGWMFTRQFYYAEPRRLRADFVVQANGDAVLVEIQGGIYSRQAHGSVTGVLADIDRLNTATIAGWRMLRFTPAQVDDGTAITLIEAALKAGEV